MKRWLEHPLTRGLDLDNPRTTHLRRRILEEKPFLRRIYEEWYARIAASLPAGEGAVLELGSGAGFLRDFVPGLVRSEVFYTPGIDAVLDGLALPFAPGSLRAIAMTNVLHHLPQPVRFFQEAARCVRPGGVATLIEPWVTPWSRGGDPPRPPPPREAAYRVLGIQAGGARCGLASPRRPRASTGWPSPARRSTARAASRSSPSAAWWTG